MVVLDRLLVGVVLLAALGEEEGKTHLDKAEKSIETEHDSIRTRRSPTVEML